MKNKFYIIGGIINAVLFFMVLMNCGGFFGCNGRAESFVLISAFINLPVSIFVATFVKSLSMKVFVMGALGTAVNGYILGAIFSSKKKTD